MATIETTITPFNTLESKRRMLKFDINSTLKKSTQQDFALYGRQPEPNDGILHFTTDNFITLNGKIYGTGGGFYYLNPLYEKMNNGAKLDTETNADNFMSTHCLDNNLAHVYYTTSDNRTVFIDTLKKSSTKVFQIKTANDGIRYYRTIEKITDTGFAKASEWQMESYNRIHKELGNFGTEQEALDALKAIEICGNKDIVHVHLTYGNYDNIIMIQSIENDYCRQIIFNKSKIFQRAIYFKDSARTQISYIEDWSFLFGDRLKWDCTSNKYILSQFGNTFNANVTDQIPIAGSGHAGLVFSEDKDLIDVLHNTCKPYSFILTPTLKPFTSSSDNTYFNYVSYSYLGDTSGTLYTITLPKANFDSCGVITSNDYNRLWNDLATKTTVNASNDGLMSKKDKSKLDSLQIPTINLDEIQSHWFRNNAQGVVDIDKVLKAAPLYLVITKRGTKDVVVGTLSAISDSMGHTVHLKFYTNYELNTDGTFSNAHNHDLGFPKEYVCTAGFQYSYNSEDPDLVIPNMKGFGRWYCPLDKQLKNLKNELDGKISANKTNISNLQTSYNNLYNSYTNLYNFTTDKLSYINNWILGLHLSTTKPSSGGTSTIVTPSSTDMILQYTTQNNTDVCKVKCGNNSEQDIMDYSNILYNTTLMQIWDSNDKMIYYGGTYTGDYLQFNLKPHKGRYSFEGYCYIGGMLSLNNENEQINSVLNNTKYIGKVYVSYLTDTNEREGSMIYPWTSDLTMNYRLGNAAIDGKNGGYPNDGHSWHLCLGSKIYDYTTNDVLTPQTNLSKVSNITQNISYFDMSDINVTASTTTTGEQSTFTEVELPINEKIKDGAIWRKYKINVPKNSGLTNITSYLYSSGVSHIKLNQIMTEDDVKLCINNLNK